MEAKVKDSHHVPVTAFGGVEYTRQTWKPVPAGKEAEAMQHPFLETRETPEPIAILEIDGEVIEFQETAVSNTAVKPKRKKAADQ